VPARGTSYWGTHSANAPPTGGTHSASRPHLLRRSTLPSPCLTPNKAQRAPQRPGVVPGVGPGWSRGSGVVPGVGPGWSRGWVRGWARHTGAQSLARSSPIAKDSVVHAQVRHVTSAVLNPTTGPKVGKYSYFNNPWIRSKNYARCPGRGIMQNSRALQGRICGPISGPGRWDCAAIRHTQVESDQLSAYKVACIGQEITRLLRGK
jgi:hypothetical protein